MEYLTIEAEITDGHIIPKDPARIPEQGRALVTVMLETPRPPDWDRVESVLGALNRPGIDSVNWQRQERAEWDRL